MYKILIGITTLDNPERLKNCLESMYKTHDMYKKEYEITVLVNDDFSSHPNLEKNKTICASYGLNLLMQPQRNGIATSWNTLINHLEAEYCILINDDVILVNNWIDCIIYTLKNNNQIGVVGLNAYEGDYSSFMPNNIPTYVESKILIGSKIRPLLSARGYAFGFRKEDYRSVNGFDQNFFCFFEEVDFNLNIMKLLKKRNCMLSYPIIKHIHGDTLLKFENHNEIFEESRVKFEKKWGVEWKKIREIFTNDLIPEIDVDFDEWNSNINIWE